MAYVMVVLVLYLANIIVSKCVSQALATNATSRASDPSVSCIHSLCVHVSYTEGCLYYTQTPPCKTSRICTVWILQGGVCAYTLDTPGQAVVRALAENVSAQVGQ